MGASARIIFFSLMLYAVLAHPAREYLRRFDISQDLEAESSKVLSKLVSTPTQRRYSDSKSSASESAVDNSDEVVSRPQTFFPSFANLFEPRSNNFRLGFGSQETAFSQRPNSYKSLLNYPFGGFNERFRSLDGFGKQETQSSAPVVDATSSVLGSGNFGIIRGGTFNAQNDDDEYDNFSSFYNNGHGRPSLGLGYIANPRPNYNQDQFANFRDFADINTPANSAYSHFVVVYANKNATIDEVSEESRRVDSPQPKNIIETLSLLDEKPVKLSKMKAKLELSKKNMLNKRNQWRKASSKYLTQHEMDEPLLALS